MERKKEIPKKTMGSIIKRRNSAVVQKTESSQATPVKKSGRALSFLDGLITFSLLAIAFGVPVFFLGMTFQGIQFEKQLFFYFWVLIALIAWVTKGVLNGKLQIRKTPLDFPILAVLLTYILATAFSIDRWHSFWGFFGDPSRGLVNVLAITVLYYITLSHFNHRRLFLVTCAIIASDIFVGIWTMLAIFGVKFLPSAIMPFAPLSLIGTVSGLGIFFSMMLPILMLAMLLLSRKGEKLAVWKKISLGVCVAASALNLFLIFSLYSFSPWLAIVVGISLFLILMLSHVVEIKGGWKGIPFVFFAAIILILLVCSSFGDFKVAKVNLPLEMSPNYKFSWDIAKQALSNNFFMGSGPSTYSYAFSKYKPQSFNENSFYDLRFFQGTGLFLELVATIGALASIALAVLLLSFLGTGGYLLLREKEREKVYALGFFISAIIFVISAFSVNIEGSIMLMGAFISIMALGALFEENSTENNWHTLSLQASPKFALALAFIFTIVSAGAIFIFMFLGKVFVADMYAGKAVRATSVSENGSISQLAKAITIFGLEGRYYTNISQQYMVLANNEFMKKDSERNTGLLQQYLTSANNFANQGETLMDKDVSTVESVASIYENTAYFIPSAAQSAEDKYKKALTLDPHNPAYFVKLGQLKMAEANAKKDAEKTQLLNQAKDFFQNSIDEKKDFAAGYYNLALAQLALGNSDEAINQMMTAVQLESNNITYLYNLGQLYQKRGGADDLKVAEALYNEIFKYNKDEMNTHISLGLLYEKEKKNDQAIEEYSKVVALIPSDSAELIAKVEKLISNVKNGKQNTFDTLGQDQQPDSQSAGQDASQSIIAPQDTAVEQPVQ